MQKGRFPRCRFEKGEEKRVAAKCRKASGLLAGPGRARGWLVECPFSLPAGPGRARSWLARVPGQPPSRRRSGQEPVRSATRPVFTPAYAGPLTGWLGQPAAPSRPKPVSRLARRRLLSPPTGRPSIWSRPRQGPVLSGIRPALLPV